MTARTWDQSPVSYWDRWLDDRQAHVYSVALDDGTVAPITLGSGRELSRQEPGLSSYDISPDGSRSPSPRTWTRPGPTRTSTCS
jgi:hypothetical protein